MIPEILLLVKEICARRSEVDDLGASVAVLLQPGTLEAVEGVTDAFATTYDAFVLIVAERALIADANEGSRSDIAITHRTFTITFVA